MNAFRFLACAALAASLSTAAFAQADMGGGGGGRSGPRPAAPPGYSYVWVSPVYQTVTQQTWIPDRITLVSDWVETSPGCLGIVYRQVVIPGHYETSTRQLLVSSGRYELIAIAPPPPIVYYYPPVVSPPVVVLNNPPVPIDSSPRFQTEDLSKFSPLTEWPK